MTAKLDLIVEEKQKNWALVIDGMAPTIDQFKRNPEKYVTIPHGFYEVRAPLEHIWAGDNGVWIRSNHGTFKAFFSNRQMLDYINLGYMKVENGLLWMQGRFEKKGAEILFKVGKQ
ncbi:hypothetical protein CPT_Melville_235 [Salmonella phage Melville]|uniref:Uncharacterized protein n=1 Tax=Salmonella phage Melville TaxID=2041413 RepID=A0A2D1GML7_9CAUD|nr:hypothetical protein FDI73_gp166 [Salmonella phage Melville]ATN93198.1 hypothetical protein CPT_Melville_235 [Salmonella phage Melville]